MNLFGYSLEGPPTNRFVAFLVGLFVCSVVPTRSHALRPDLVPEVTDVSVERSDVSSGDVAEGCAGGASDRLLLQYSLRARNVGAGDLEMGAPMCPDCSDNPGAVCGNPLYICSPAHGHAHFDSFAHSDLLDSNNNVVAHSQKSGFCLLDFECADPKYSCSFQGISAGCADVYERGLPCQYMDLTDANLADGLYSLRVTMDPQDAIDEENENNNTVIVPVEIALGGASCPRMEASDTPRSIPDNGFATSTVTANVSGWVTRLRVLALHFDHPNVGDLEIHLRGPDGTDVTMINRVCAGSAGVSLDLDDGAPTEIPCPPTDGMPHRPGMSFKPFLGKEASGDWTITAFDRKTGESGSITGWTLELCTEPQCSIYSTFTSSDVPKTIPDEGNVVSSVQVPPSVGSVGRVEVLGLAGTHTYVGDVEVLLRSPAGTEVTLMNRECAANHNFNLSLSSFAPSLIPCPPTDGWPHLPASSFTAFLGELAGGEWQLSVYDRAPQDTGTLDAWGLRICSAGSASASCPTSPASNCLAAASSRLKIHEDTNGIRSSLRWKWNGPGMTVAQFGSPSSSSGYALCLYADDVLKATWPITSAGTCNGRACWMSMRDHGFRYRKHGGNKNGIDRVTLRAAHGEGRIEVRGQGSGLVPPLPLNAAANVKAQLIRSDASTCWESDFSVPATESTDANFDDRLR